MNGMQFALLLGTLVVIGLGIAAVMSRNARRPAVVPATAATPQTPQQVAAQVAAQIAAVYEGAGINPLPTLGGVQRPSIGRSHRRGFTFDSAGGFHRYDDTVETELPRHAVVDVGGAIIVGATAPKPKSKKDGGMKREPIRIYVSAANAGNALVEPKRDDGAVVADEKPATGASAAVVVKPTPGESGKTDDGSSHTRAPKPKK